MPDQDKSQTSLTDSLTPHRIWNWSNLAAVLSIVLALEIVGIGGYYAYRIQRALEPEVLADRAEDAIRESYPEFREKLVVTVKQQAPEIADALSAEILASFPDARVRLEQFTGRQLERGIDKVTALSTDQFRLTLRENREDVVQLLEAIEKAPDKVPERVIALEKRIEKQLGVDVQTQARQALREWHAFNDELERLTSEDAKLTERDRAEQRVLRILKTMQKRDGQPPQQT